jgi:hypothetical protein
MKTVRIVNTIITTVVVDDEAPIATMPFVITQHLVQEFAQFVASDLIDAGYDVQGASCEVTHSEIL